MRFLIFLILYALIEIALFSSLGAAIGVGAVLILVILGFFVGSALIRRSSYNLRNELSQFQAGQVPANPTQPFVYLLSGLLIILPGFFTDALGLLLLLPPVRALLWCILPVQMHTNQAAGAQGFYGDSGRIDIIEGEIISEDDPQSR